MRMGFWRAKTKKASEITEGRFLVDRLPAMTDEKIWKGTGGNVEEVDIPSVGVTTALAASDALRNSNDDEKGTVSATYVKIKEVLLNADLDACRIKFRLRTSDDELTVYAQIYKDGIAIGLERSYTLSGGQLFSEDFSVFISGEKIQIYAHGTESATSYVKEMRFYYSEAISHIGEYELVTPLPDSEDPTISMTNQDP